MAGIFVMMMEEIRPMSEMDVLWSSTVVFRSIFVIPRYPMIETPLLSAWIFHAFYCHSVVVDGCGSGDFIVTK